MDWKKLYQEKLKTPEEAVKLVKSGDRIFIGTASGIAFKLCEALYGRKDELEDVVICHGMTMRVLPFFEKEAAGHFSTVSYFAGTGERVGIKNGQTKYTSLHLSQIVDWCQHVARPNVAFFEVSEPDSEGYMSYGAFPAFSEHVREMADVVILQINKNVPYTVGKDCRIHISQANAVAEADDDLLTIPNMPFDDTIKTLSQYIVDEIPDGATLQLGLGSLSNAVGFGLMNRNDLGIHSEMMTDSMMELMKAGVVTNRKKTLLPGKSVAAFAIGTPELYNFINHNEDMYFAPYSYVNDPAVIAQNDTMISVNTAMSIDLYGQVCADCLAGNQQSATGGQIDYVRGAQMSKGGKSFIALTSTLTNKRGTSSRIVASFPAGTAVTTPRADVQYVVTEYGCVNLKHLTMDDRARAIINLAHPDFRDELAEQAKQLHIL